MLYYQPELFIKNAVDRIEQFIITQFFGISQTTYI